MPKLKTQLCPACMGKGFVPENRYCHSCSKHVQVAWKRCMQCKGTGAHLEHLLYTLLQLPIKETPKLPRSR
jgi:predicted amidophosphoribosyltransferase